jgi:hypothetical protein
MKLLFLLVFTAIIFAACSKYPGYKRITPEIYFSLYQFGEQGKKPVIGDYLTIKIEYRTRKDSLFFSGTRKIRLN